MTQVDPPTLYRVAVFAIPEDRSDLAEVLVETLSMMPTDVAIQARNLPGLITGEFPVDAAGRAVQAFAGLGLQAEAIPADQAPRLHPFESPHHLRWPAEGLQILGINGEVESTIPWDCVEMISVGQVPLDSTNTTPTGKRRSSPPGDITSPKAIRRRGSLPVPKPGSSAALRIESCGWIISGSTMNSWPGERPSRQPRIFGSF